MKKTLYFVLGIMLLVSGCKSEAQLNPGEPLAIIPAPVSLTELNGNFVFTGKSKIILSPLNNETKLAADFLCQLVKNPTGLNPEITEGNKSATGSVFMTLDTVVKNNEGYILTVTPKKMVKKI